MGLLIAFAVVLMPIYPIVPFFPPAATLPGMQPKSKVQTHFVSEV